MFHGKSYVSQVTLDYAVYCKQIDTEIPCVRCTVHGIVCLYFNSPWRLCNVLSQTFLIHGCITLLGLGRYGHQPYRYVFDTDPADTIRIRYDTLVHDLMFQNLECLISTIK